jgi:hypothetical protein
VAVEVEHLEMNAMYSAQGQFEQSKLWRSVNLLLGVPAAALAAAAAGTGLATATNHVIAGVLALVAAGLGAAVTAMGAQRRAAHASESGNAYLALQTEARQLRLIDLENLDPSQVRARLEELTQRYNNINSAADPPSFYAYWRATRNIKKGRQEHPELQHPQGA